MRVYLLFSHPLSFRRRHLVQNGGSVSLTLSMVSQPALNSLIRDPGASISKASACFCLNTLIEAMSNTVTLNLRRV